MVLDSLAIIPAAGKATRFGGTLKELLPVYNGLSLLEMCFHRLPRTTETLVVSTPEKIAEHSRVMGNRVLYTVQGEKMDIWGAILEALQIPAKRYFFMMPDTLSNILEKHSRELDFQLGLFETMKPYRFGCIVDGVIVNKSVQVRTPAFAWGALSWSQNVRSFWFEQMPETYTKAINIAMKEFGYETCRIDPYYDFASFEDYTDFIRSHHGKL